MFEKLRRAKSFIHRAKRDEESDANRELDLSETSHLRRNVSIDGEALERQKKLNRSREKLSDHKGRKLRRQGSRSQENLHDQVLEQIRRINFGDSYSKKDAQKLSQTKEAAWALQRQAPAYVSERNFRRKSIGADDNAVKHGRAVHHRTKGDVVSNFDRNNAAYSSERASRPKYELNSSTDDFLLNRKSVDMSYNFDKRNPGYIPDRSVSRKKSDVFEKTGLRSLFQKLKSGSKSEVSDVGSFSECSTGSSSASFSYTHGNQNYNSGSCSNTSTASSSTSVDRDTTKSLAPQRRVIRGNSDAGSTSIFDKSHPSYYSQENYAQTHNKHVIKDANTRFPRNHPAYSSERVSSPQRAHEESIRKRSHYQTKPNFDKNKPAGTSENAFQRESRKKVFDRIKRADGDLD